MRDIKYPKNITNARFWWAEKEKAMETKINYFKLLQKIESNYESMESFAELIGIPTERLDAIFRNEDDFTIPETERIQAVFRMTDAELKECLFTPLR